MSFYRLGVDVGGTFTDFVLVDDVGHLTEAKTPSTPHDPGQALGAGLQELAGKIGISLDELLHDCRLLMHGTTVAINAVIQHRGVKTGLICTEGFRDTLEIRLGYRDQRYDFRDPPPPLLVPRHLRLPVRERIDKKGQVLTPLADEAVYQVIAKFQEEGVEAIAVCLLWSFLNPIHEKRIGELIRAEMPGVYVSLSYDVAPQIREYDRVSTTVLNSYVGPRVNRYLQQTENYLRELGYSGEVRYIQSNGGVAARHTLAQRPVLLMNSGPAAAPAAASFFGKTRGSNNLITMDMGGTSFDTCLIEHGHPSIVGVADVHRYRLAAPMININTVGAGGGSIAWIHNGILRVGPQSAEAYPGPACYMRGGNEPTVTDADVVLGYLNPKALLGGKFKIAARLARAAIEGKIATALGIALEEASLGICDIVNRNMANSISEISLARGYDPRDFVAVAAGGQGAVHAGAIVGDLGISTIIIPKVASIFCAFGALVTDLRHDYKRSYGMRLDRLTPDHLEQTFRAMEETGREDLLSEGVTNDSMIVVRRLDMRYVGQIYEVPVDVSNLRLDNSAILEITERFHQQHKREYTYRLDNGLGEIVNATVTVIGKLPGVHLPSQGYHGPNASHAIRAERPVLFPGRHDYTVTPVYDGTDLLPGNKILGPSIVEESNTTIVVLPGYELELTVNAAYEMRRIDEVMEGEKSLDAVQARRQQADQLLI